MNLQARGHDAELLGLGDDVVAGDVGEGAAAAERHGELELVLEHLEHVAHPGLPRSSSRRPGSQARRRYM